MELSADGTWRMTVLMFDADGAEVELRDEGPFQRSGDELAFQSNVFGDRFGGGIDAPLVHYYYDWCPGGQADVDMMFTR